MLIKDFQALDRLIFEWSILEEHPLPQWRPPISRYVEILSNESWRDSPSEVLQSYLEEV
jgi:hypothetical protein